MPKPLIDETDPNLSQLNEVLVDFITKNISEVSSKTLIFADTLSLLMFPLGFVSALIHSFFLFCSLLLLGLISSIYFDLISVAIAILLTVLLTGVFSKHLRQVLSGVIFHTLNILTFGHLIKVLSKAYQSNEPLTHHLLRSEGLVFPLLGTYAETLSPLKRNKYHGYIEKYQESRYGSAEDFAMMISNYWSESAR